MYIFTRNKSEIKIYLAKFRAHTKKPSFKITFLF